MDVPNLVFNLQRTFTFYKALIKILLLFILVIGNKAVFAQVTLHGLVKDLGSHKPLGQVHVKASLSGHETATDDSGRFVLKLNAITDSVQSEEIAISLIDNHFRVAYSEPVLAELFTISGTKLSLHELPVNGMLVLQPQASGYYFIRIASTTQIETFLLFCNGSNFQLLDADGASNVLPIKDSIVEFSKEMYYSTFYKLAGSFSPTNVQLLRKTYEDLDYFEEIPSYEAFEMLHSSPPLSNYGEVQSVKVVYDFVADKIYYINLKKHQSHYHFAEQILGYAYGVNNFFWTQYNISPHRFLHLLTINYHVSLDKFVFEFDSFDKVDCAGIELSFQKLIQTAYFKDKLYFYANNTRWANCVDVPKITSEELYQGQNYQALNLEENYGFLRKIDIEDLPNTYLSKHDMVLLNGIPNELSIVSGIITTEYQTAFSHINILSHNRHTPNMVLRDGFTNPLLDSLLGSLVYLKVESNQFSIRKANLEEALAFWQLREPQEPVILDVNLDKQGIVELAEEDFYSVNAIGGKAANFAELVNLDSIPLPEDYFAIPFYYYHKHMVDNGLDTIVTHLLADTVFLSNLEYRSAKLQALRESIVAAPLNQNHTTMVLSRIDNFSRFEAYRFRSSTNAEDLENFSGAGLYDSYSAQKGSSSKSVDKTIKKVWASLWNLRAFDEREYYNIDHRFVEMGILVHRSSPQEDANGVIITKNLYSGNHAYTVNAQYQENSVVQPEPGIMHDQLLIYTVSLDSIGYTIEYLTQSNIPELGGAPVLTDEELYEIAELCTIVKKHYYYNIPNNCNCSYNDFAVDIEFKIDSQVETRKIYFKQARIYSSD